MDTWSFVFATDIHVGSPRSFRFAPAWNENWQIARKQIVALKPDFLLLGGDIARDGGLRGHRFELEAIKEDLEALPFPYYVTPGNMDTGNKHTEVDGPFDRDDPAINMTSAQLRKFEAVFGPSCWTFEHKGARFSSFCDMVAGSGLPEEQALWAWLEEQAQRPPAPLQVWVMHSALFIENVEEPNWDIRDPKHYHDWYFGIDKPWRTRLMKIFRASEADLVLCGHVHCRKTHMADGIRFDIGPSTAFPQWEDRWPDGDATLGFMRYEVSDDSIRPEFVPLEKVSDAKGYGPGGHPKPEARDYSIAWERPKPIGENDE